MGRGNKNFLAVLLQTETGFMVNNRLLQEFAVWVMQRQELEWVYIQFREFMKQKNANHTAKMWELPSRQKCEDVSPHKDLPKTGNQS